MRVAVVGGGPAGLHVAALLHAERPGDDITVWERGPTDTDTGRGFGVVLSEQALAGLGPGLRADILAAGVSWTDLVVHHRGERVTSTGHAFTALSRACLLEVLRKRCAGVDVRLGEAAPALKGFDLVIGADGTNSATRARLPGPPPSVEAGRCGYVWLDVEQESSAFEFRFVETPGGVVALHCYPYALGRTTVVAEGRVLPAPAELARLVSDALGGEPVIGADVRGQRFRTVTAGRWRHENTVLIGDAAHTTHFSIGSGTRLAFEDAACLVRHLGASADVPTALAGYEQERRPAVASAQRAAYASAQWFEDVGQYLHQTPAQFAVNLLTRSRRVTEANLAVRDPAFAAAARRGFAGSDRPPMFEPFRLRGLELPNRVMLSPMAMYSADAGRVGDFHLVHLGSRALGGAGLVMTEMTAVSADARITPRCAGLYEPGHEDAYRRIVEFVRGNSAARIGVQLGHAGRKGSVGPPGDGERPLPAADGWRLLAPSAEPFFAGGQVPTAMTRADMDAVLAQFVAATMSAARAGFDLLELHCAHGYLLSSFLTPLSNRRTDRYGGSLAGRLRYPLEVFEAVRAVWPEDRPTSVRISATDWVAGGVDAEEGVAIARAFAEAGADVIDVSTGLTSPDAAPRYGRAFQVPFADRIRNTLGVPTIAVGAISTYDDVNSLLLAGRADICAIGRAFLHDPAWVRRAAAEQG